jgi:hypothetical protein
MTSTPELTGVRRELVDSIKSAVWEYETATASPHFDSHYDIFV